ncbi:UNVERIFIED_CONTAM: KRUF family protein [Hammondia hammondi]|eukprot:XP_008888990.1 KRUF family protein [Hammondia hammondi]
MVAGFPPRPVPGARDVTFADLAIFNLRREAEIIEATWSHGLDYYVAQQAALRMVRENDPSPGPTTQRQWAYCDRRAFRSGVTQHQKKAHDMKNKANALELELRTLLSSASVQVPEPVRESGSTADPSAEQSSERPLGKRKQKRKHLSQTSVDSAGEGPSSACAMASPLPLWLTPVSAMRHLARQIDPKKPHGAGGLLLGSSTPQQLLPSARGSHGGSGPSSSTSKHARLTTGGPLPQRPTPVPTTTRPHPADVEGDFGDPTPPHPKKRRLLEFLSAHTAALETTPPAHCRPPV